MSYRQVIYTRSAQGLIWMGNTNIPMAAEVLKQLDLPQSALGQDLLAEDIGHFLDGYSFSGL